MEFKLDGSLKNAIVSAADEHTKGMEIPVGRFFKTMKVDTSGYLIADLLLTDGRKAQAQITITSNYDNFIDAESNIPKIRMEEEEVDDDVTTSCNGCGKPLKDNEIAYQNDEIGHDYCVDCAEAIKSDPESAGSIDGLDESEVDNA